MEKILCGLIGIMSTVIGIYLVALAYRVNNLTGVALGIISLGAGAIGVYMYLTGRD